MALAATWLLSQLSHPEALPPKSLLSQLREAAGPAPSAESSNSAAVAEAQDPSYGTGKTHRRQLQRARDAVGLASSVNASAGSCRNQPPEAWDTHVREQVTRIREVLTATPGQATEPCCDWMGETPQSAPTKGSLGPLEFVSVLAFSAVGLEYAPHTRYRTLFLNELGVSSFLAHYDDGAVWYRSQGWYAQLVKYSASYHTTSKSRYLANALKHRYNDVFAFFSHVWLLDEDVLLPPPHHVYGFVSIAARLQATLAQPTLEAATWSLLHPSNECAVRETDMVEIQMPLMRTQAAVEVFSKLFPEGLTSDWGLDATWCRYLEGKYGPGHPTCIVTNSGGFRKTNLRSSNYTRLESELCMRSARKDLVAEMRTRRCVDQDVRRATIPASEPMFDAQLWPLYGDADDIASKVELHKQASERASESRATRPVRMYVYDIAALNLSSMCFSEIDYDSPMSDFTYETHLEAELRAVTEVTTDPSTADFFLLPVCLSQFWASTVSWNDEGTMVSSCGNCLQDYEAQLLSAMRSVGPWYDDHPGKHLLSRHRCPSHNEPKNTWIIAGGMASAFPELWHSSKIAYACVESVLPSTGADLDMYRAVTREVHLPYFTNGNAMEAMPPVVERRRDVGFAGSLRHRDWIAEEFATRDILNSGEDVGVNPATLRSFLRGSKFALQPVGDTQVLMEGDMRVGVQPSSQQIYTALHAGTPLVFTEHVRPPLRLWDWHGVAIDAFGASLLANQTSLDDDLAAEAEVAKFGRGWRTILDAESAQKAAAAATRSTTLRRHKSKLVNTNLRRHKSKQVNDSLAPEPWQLIRTARLPLSPPPTSLQRALERYPSFIQHFETARAPFIWRTRPFRSQLRRVLQFVFLTQPTPTSEWQGRPRNDPQTAPLRTPQDQPAGPQPPDDQPTQENTYRSHHGDPKEEARMGREHLRQAKEHARRQRMKDRHHRWLDPGEHPESVHR